MHSYTITIAPNDDSGSTTTLVVDTSGSQVRITDVHLHAAQGLVGGQMPTVDFGLLLRAVTPGTNAPAPIETTATPTPIAAAPRADTANATVPDAVAPPIAERADVDGAAPTARRRREPQAGTPAKRSRSRRTTAAETAAPEAKSTAKPARRGATGKTTAAKQKSSATTSGRAYRRAPGDFTAVYERLGSASAIAEHYSVPRYTAQGWITRLRAADRAARDA